MVPLGLAVHQPCPSQARSYPRLLECAGALRGRKPCLLPMLCLFHQRGCGPPAQITLTLCSCSFQHVIRGNRPIKTEMAHQLYVLQVLTFNLLEERMMTKMDPNDQVGCQWDWALPAGIVCLATWCPLPCVWSTCCVPGTVLRCVCRNSFVSSVPHHDPFLLVILGQAHLCPSV